MPGRRIENIDYPAYRTLASGQAFDLGNRKHVDPLFYLNQQYANPDLQGALAGAEIAWHSVASGENMFSLRLALRHVDDAALSQLKNRGLKPHISPGHDMEWVYLHDEPSALSRDYIMVEVIGPYELLNKEDAVEIHKLPSMLKKKFGFLAESGAVDAASLEKLETAIIASLPTEKSQVKTFLRPMMLLNKTAKQNGRE